jgi:hypothetical protein
VRQVNYLGIFGGTRKKPLKTTLVAVARILSAANVKKSSENYLSFCGTKTFCGKHKKKTGENYLSFGGQRWAAKNYRKKSIAKENCRK